MTLRETLTNDMRVALKARDKPRLSTIRMLLAAVQGATKDKGGELDEAEELAILAREAKRRRESIEAFRAGGRDDLADKETDELALIQTYMPEQLSVEEVRALVAEAIATVGATSQRDLGRVMGAVMPKLKGRFPGKEVRPIVAALLSE